MTCKSCKMNFQSLRPGQPSSKVLVRKAMTTFMMRRSYPVGNGRLQANTFHDKLAASLQTCHIALQLIDRLATRDKAVGAASQS